MFEINNLKFDKERGNVLEVYSGVAYRVSCKKQVITKDDLIIDPDTGNLIISETISNKHESSVGIKKIKKTGSRHEV